MSRFLEFDVMTLFYCVSSPAKFNAVSHFFMAQVGLYEYGTLVIHIVTLAAVLMACKQEESNPETKPEVETKEAESSGSDWSEVDPDGYEDVACVCLFCEETRLSTNEIFPHMTTSHMFDMKSFIQSRELNFYDVIRLINYVRAEKACPADIFSSISPHIWEEAKFYSPVIQDDPMLTYDYGFD